VPDPWSIRLLRAALQIQDRVTDEVPEELRVSGAGRKAKITIDGKDDGGEMYLRWSGERLIEEADSVGVRNNFSLHSRTLLDLATGELKAREAVAARLIHVSGDRSIYDEEDIMKLFEKLQATLVKHLQRRGI
jgi:putative sterol carrier protein